MTDERSGEARAALAELACEFWKLLRNYDHVVAAAPDSIKPGLVAQVNFGTRRLSSILLKAGLHVETFNGAVYSANLPVAAVNADDFADGAEPVVEQTLEPAIISGTTPVRTGRVYLRAANSKET